MADLRVSPGDTATVYDGRWLVRTITVTAVNHGLYVAADIDGRRRTFDWTDVLGACPRGDDSPPHIVNGRWCAHSLGAKTAG